MMGRHTWNSLSCISVRYRRTHLALLVYVRVVDLGTEGDLGWLEWVFSREDQVNQEGTLIR